MLAGEIHAPRQIRLVDVPNPQLPSKPRDGEPGEMIFQPELACLCGSDLVYFEGDYPEFSARVGQSLHEMIGTVVATSGKRFSEGQRVLCVPTDHGGLQEQFSVSEARGVPIDPRLTDVEAVLSQPLGTVIYGLKKFQSVLDHDVVVLGQGPIGLLFTAALRNLGARKIVAVDLLPERLEVSRQMGATHTINASTEDTVEVIKDLTDGALMDLVVEAVGHREHVMNTCIDLCRPHGKILFFGVPTERLDAIEWRKLWIKNGQVLTSHGPDFRRDFPLAMQWIAERRLDVTPLSTHRFPITEIQQAFDLFLDRQDGAIKVFVEFSS